jgi:dihydropteroate synthase
MESLRLPPTRVRNRQFADGATAVMAILNVTPDSFSDGGAFVEVDRAVEHALRMEGEGAAIIDVGGESTRPGSAGVSAEVEAARVVPVIEAIRRRSDVPLSIDTSKAAVAEAALRAGADLVNDVTGLHGDPRMARVVADAGVPVVVMHLPGTPRTMQQDPTYVDVFADVAAWLNESIRLAAEAGVPRERVVVDPGLGFGKTVEHNVVLMRRIPDLARATGCPVLLGPSRKSFLGALLSEPAPRARLFGTAAAVALAAAWGARFVRVHDVRAMVQVARVAAAIGGA